MYQRTNCKCYNYKNHLEEIITINLHDLGFSKGSLAIPTKSQGIKENWTVIKIKIQ
jgi:hypothetical protein